jgi:hypothetical protein
MKIDMVFHVAESNMQSEINKAVQMVKEEALRNSDGLISVTVMPYAKAVSRKEMNYFHVLCGRLATQSGHEKGYIKELVKQKAIDWGYPPAYDEDGMIVMDNLTNLPKPLSVAKATNQQVSVLLDVLYGIASDNGIVLDDRE